MATPTEAKKRPWLTRNLVVLSWVSLFQDVASELLYPILPILLTTTLGAPVAVVAITEGMADGAAAFLKVVSGRLADRRGRKGLVAFGYALAAVAKVLIAIATIWPVVMAARVLDRVGKGVRGAPRDALIADTTDPQYRGRAFGFHRALDTTGAVIGPLIGLGLFTLFDERLRPILIIAAVPAILSASLVVLVKEAPPPKPTVAASTSGATEEPPLPRRYWRVAILLGLFALVNFSDALLLLRAHQLGIGIAGLILLYCLYNLTYALASYPAGAVSDRLPRRLVFAVGLIVFAVAYTGLGLATTAAAAWVLLPIYGFYTALTDGVAKAWLVDLVAPTARGRAIGYQQGIAGGAAMAAGLWAGLLWGGDGKLPLIVAGIVAAVLAGVLIAAGRGLDPAKAQSSGAAAVA